MSIYHKSIKLSTQLNKILSRILDYFIIHLTGSIAIISLTSLMFNFIFPHVALASDAGIGRKNVLAFNYSEAAGVLFHIQTKNNILSAEASVVDSIEKDNRKIFVFPIESTKEEEKVNKIIVLALAKKIINEENDKIAEDICREAGLDSLPCWQDLKAMREKESFGGTQMTGDAGRSRGWYHIQIKMHNVSDWCAMDFKCSTEWTVKNLIAHNYKTNRLYAISRHNGSGQMAQNYARSVVYNSGKLEK